MPQSQVLCCTSDIADPTLNVTSYKNETITSQTLGSCNTCNETVAGSKSDTHRQSIHCEDDNQRNPPNWSF